jgi:hypothetical protein
MKELTFDALLILHVIQEGTTTRYAIRIDANVKIREEGIPLSRTHEMTKYKSDALIVELHKSGFIKETDHPIQLTGKGERIIHLELTGKGEDVLYQIGGDWRNWPQVIPLNSNKPDYSNAVYL